MRKESESKLGLELEDEETKTRHISFRLKFKISKPILLQIDYLLIT